MALLEGKIAVITGAARGQGRSHALRLAQEGADIIAIDICKQVETVPYATSTPDDLAETVRQVEALDRRILSYQADIRDSAALKEAIDDGVAKLGGLDIVVANAGISVPASTLEMSDEVWQTTIDVDLTGQWKTIKAAVPHIIAGGRGGSVVIISSLAAVIANENTAHYSAAKAGLVGLMTVLARELAPKSIRVNTIHPTTVATDMVLNEPTYKLFRPDLETPTRADFEVAQRSLNSLPVGAIDPIDISEAVLYLVANSGRYVTGTTHLVSAGGQIVSSNSLE
jgi:SDR family mycofactocin-dependent oxidoreductase